MHGVRHFLGQFGRRLVVAGLLAAPAMSGSAAEEVPGLPVPGSAWIVDPARSEIAVRFAVNGSPLGGRFTEFSGAGRFVTGDPSRAELRLAIAAASLDLGIGIFSRYAAEAEEWFDAQTYPEVVFDLERLEPGDAGSRYLAIGGLTIKGQTLPAQGRVTLAVENGTARATGELTVDRAAYDLGLGPSAAIAEVSEVVAVRFALEARPKVTDTQ
ncbi:MAG: YceI family protein [Pikeienuella sp.]